MEIAKEYLLLDKNDENRQEIERLVSENNSKELLELLGKRLEFGTAGLRGQMGAGYNRMNDLTVLQASQGLYAYLKNTTSLETMGVVIGHDHRHNSERFAKLSAAVFLSKEIPVYYFKNLVHTPMIPFSLRHLKAAAGLMITASHNPKQDNGMKVYGQNGCQIISPADKDISKCILDNLIPWTWDVSLVDTSPKCIDQSSQLIDLYFEKCHSLLHFKEKTPSVKLVYSAMHGVGFPFASRIARQFGLELIPVKEQMEPDPNFKTLPFPNPEEKGSLDIAMRAADDVGAPIILANDPDADRLAVAEKTNGQWYVFNGNEMGMLFASFCHEIYKNQSVKIAVLSTVVSSHGLKAFAEANGIYFEETLTGFKWLGNRALELADNGYKVILAYEEAIGFMVGSSFGIYDKDGISSLGVLADWINHLYFEEKTLYEHLEDLYRTYGYIVSNNSYVICHDKVKIEQVFDEIRAKGNYIQTIAHHKVVWVRDLTNGYDSRSPTKKPTLPVSKSSQMITFELENGCLITLRTSGTEPKVKYYTEIKSDNYQQGMKFLKVVEENILLLLRPLL